TPNLILRFTLRSVSNTHPFKDFQFFLRDFIILSSIPLPQKTTRNQTRAAMFAVPGWSVAADGPKAENAAAQNGGKGKKRKRPEATITGDNLESMWDKVIEGKKPGQEGSKR